MTTYAEEIQTSYEAGITKLAALFQIKAQLTNQDLLDCCNAKITECQAGISVDQAKLNNIQMAQNSGFSDEQMRLFI